jgi:hypothetical protein
MCLTSREILIEAYTMEINNLERNVIYLLGRQLLKTRTSGPFDTSWIFDTFSDIPDENMKDALLSLQNSGYVELTSSFKKINLTRKGFSKIKVIDLPHNGRLPFPRELD